MKPVTDKHVQMMAELVEFLQKRGWDVCELSLERWVRRAEHDIPGEDAILSPEQYAVALRYVGLREFGDPADAVAPLLAHDAALRRRLAQVEKELAALRDQLADQTEWTREARRLAEQYRDWASPAIATNIQHPWRAQLPWESASGTEQNV